MSTWAGNLIRLARHQKGLSQREIARRAQTSQAAIAAYEAGRRSPTLETLSRIIRGAGLDLRIRLEERDDHDQWLARYEAELPPEVVEARHRRDRELVAAHRAERGALISDGRGETSAMSAGSEYSEVAFERIVEVLSKRKVKYVVIGALAALLQGVPLPRSADIDVTPSSDVANKKKLAQALQELDAQLRTPGSDEPFEIPLDERTFTGMVTMMFVTNFGPLDISFAPDGTDGYEDLARGARVVERFGVKIPVSSVADIVRSKRGAGREKDAAHLPHLLALLDEEARSSE